MGVVVSGGPQSQISSSLAAEKQTLKANEELAPGWELQRVSCCWKVRTALEEPIHWQLPVLAPTTPADPQWVPVGTTLPHSSLLHTVQREGEKEKLLHRKGFGGFSWGATSEAQPRAQFEISEESWCWIE